MNDAMNYIDQPRVWEALELLRAAPNGMQRSELAAAMNISPSTAGVYLQCLRHRGMATRSSIGCAARWTAQEGARAEAAKGRNGRTALIVAFVAANPGRSRKEIDEATGGNGSSLVGWLATRGHIFAAGPAQRRRYFPDRDSASASHERLVAELIEQKRAHRRAVDQRRRERERAARPPAQPRQPKPGAAIAPPQPAPPKLSAKPANGGQAMPISRAASTPRQPRPEGREIIPGHVRPTLCPSFPGRYTVERPEPFFAAGKRIEADTWAARAYG